MDALTDDECYRQIYADCDSVFYQKVKRADVNESDVVVDAIPPIPKQSDVVKLIWERRVSPHWKPRGVLVTSDMPLPLKSMG